jgi:hypothetical protein
MVDYPLVWTSKPGGIVRFLEDTDNDGRYDKSTVFLEGVNFPTGVMPWRNGVLVSAAPDIFYAEDSDGDGKADIRTVLFSGFVEGNQQHRVNGFEYGLDNWVYGANGDSGGKIRVNTLKAESVRRSRGHRLACRPARPRFRLRQTREFEATSSENNSTGTATIRAIGSATAIRLGLALLSSRALRVATLSWRLRRRSDIWPITRTRRVCFPSAGCSSASTILAWQTMSLRATASHLTATNYSARISPAAFS